MRSKKIKSKSSNFRVADRVLLSKDLNPLTRTAICNICGKRRKMSRDHIPLRALGNAGIVIIKPHHKRLNIKEIKSQDGLAFKTICAECNNMLGSLYDKPFSDFIKDVKKYADCIFKTDLILPRHSADFETVPSHLARSVVGHMLASRIHHNGPYFKELRAYVLDPKKTLPESLHLYTWFYCDSTIKVLPEYVIPILSKDLKVIVFYIIKSYPCAFVLTDSSMSGEGIVDLLSFPNKCDASVTIDLLHHPPPNWPESEFVPKAGQFVIIGANNKNSAEV